MQRYTVYFIWKLLYMFRLAPPPIIRSANNCIYSICYLSHRYRFECAVGGLRHPQHTQTSSNSSTIAADSSNGMTNTRCCRYCCMRSWWWWKYHPKHVEQFPDINKLCNVASCWIYIGILLGAHCILHISRIRVKQNNNISTCTLSSCTALYSHLTAIYIHNTTSALHVT